MLTVTDLVRRYLAGDRETSDALASLERDLLATVEAQSLCMTINSALDLRKTGRIDQSIALITRANRNQLDAVEGIQKSIDSVRAQREHIVIFAKYRQFYPFEIGIENGDDVLALLSDFTCRSAPETDERRAKLHELEGKKHAEDERLAFFEQRFDDGSEDGTITESRQIIQAIDDELSPLKQQILEDVLSTVEAFLSKCSDLKEKDKLTVKLSKWLFILVTSPTATRHADSVRTES